jgi:hypothetical protein
VNPMRSGTELTAFEVSLGARLRVASIVDAHDESLIAIQFGPALRNAASCALAILYDLSDSYCANDRLLRRLPDLLRGWYREMPLWLYSLSDDAPLPSAEGLNVGHLVDDPALLLPPLEDARLISRFRRRGSFLQPPLTALAERANSEGVRSLHIVTFGDALFSDFVTLQLPAAAELLAVVESQEAVARAEEVWSRVVGSPTADLFSFDDTRLAQWFKVRGEASYPSCEIRFLVHSGATAYSVESRGKPATLGANWIAHDLRTTSHRYLIRGPSGSDFSIEVRQGVKSTRLDRDSALGAPPMDDADRKVFEAAVSASDDRSLSLLFNSDNAGSGLDAPWKLAANACESISAQQAEAIALLRAVVDPKKENHGAVVIASRQPAGTPAPGDRLVLLGLSSVRHRLSWTSGDNLQVGVAKDSWAIQFDELEDRWSIAVGRSGGSPRTPVVLNRVPMQVLPPLSTSDDRTWFTCFLLFEL